LLVKDGKISGAGAVSLQLCVCVRESISASHEPASPVLVERAPLLIGNSAFSSDGRYIRDFTLRCALECAKSDFTSSHDQNELHAIFRRRTRSGSYSRQRLAQKHARALCPRVTAWLHAQRREVRDRSRSRPSQETGVERLVVIDHVNIGAVAWAQRLIILYFRAIRNERLSDQR
jgi:hypothetical protein